MAKAYEFDSMEIANCPTCEDADAQSQSMGELLRERAASRIASKDADLYGFSQSAADMAGRFMGWTDLCTNPPIDPAEIAQFADEMRAAGLTDVVVIGQGGSSQAPMTMSELMKSDDLLDVGFYVMDSLSPVSVSAVLDAVNIPSTVFVISSKSGSTIEPNMIFKCVWHEVCQSIGEANAGSRFVAITDPGSKLEQLATDLRFARIFHGTPEVGGRFSAMSAFGLVPFALMGIDVKDLVDECAEVQLACSVDDQDNPAARIAEYINECRIAGRDKLTLVFDESCKSLGLWLEQLIAESLGKDGKGVLPNTECDPTVLSTPRADRAVIVYKMASDDEDFESGKPEQALDIDASMPVLQIEISSPQALAQHFVLWEYAVAMLGSLMEVDPFDQPNVEATKVAVRQILGLEPSDSTTSSAKTMAVECNDGITIEYELSRALSGLSDRIGDTADILRNLVASAKSGDYISVDAFLPAADDGRAKALESLRSAILHATQLATCLEIGPRYLHSIGQFQKGGPNNGVFLLLSAEEEKDIQIPGENFSLATLAATQAKGDFKALDNAGRRAIRIHLVSNSSATIAKLASIVSEEA